MKRNAILFLICGIIVAVLLAGCTAPQATTPPATTPATPAPTTPVVTTAAPSSTLPGTWTLISMLAGTGTFQCSPGHNDHRDLCKGWNDIGFCGV